MITFSHQGDFSSTEKFLKKAAKADFMKNLEKYGRMGVEALRSATPSRTGKTAASWGYEIERSGSTFTIYWTNSNKNGNVNIAVILQYGHGTGTGGYVKGRDYINPAIRPVFDKIAEEAWKEVTST